MWVDILPISIDILTTDIVFFHSRDSFESLLFIILYIFHPFSFLFLFSSTTFGFLLNNALILSTSLIFPLLSFVYFC